MHDEEPARLDDIRFLRDVVDRTQPRPGRNRYWPVTLSWGVVIAASYAVCALLGFMNRTNVIPWVMPIAIFGVGWPLHGFLVRRVRRGIENEGRRPRPRLELILPWTGIAAMGLLATAWLIATGIAAERWYLIPFVWSALNFVGYILNGVLISREWFWAAGVLLASMVATGIAGPDFYWVCAIWIPATFLLPGLMGYRDARRDAAEA